MPSSPEFKQRISERIQAFATQPLRKASLSLFSAIGYKSDRTLQTRSVADFRAQFDPEFRLAHPAALIESWQSVEMLFQLTDAELSNSTALFKDEAVKASLLQSYIFIAIELTEGDYARGKLAGIARQINRIFPMPVMVLFKIGGRLSIAVINRRLNKHDESKDVLGKVTLIQKIVIQKPHPGHLDILASFSLEELTEGRRVIQNFDQLHAAWEEVFNVELLNKRFYRELANWYFWALPQVDFPADIEKDNEKRRATGLIRLLTRLIFCWFLKEKGLVPDELFAETELRKILKDLSPNTSTYNEAILQNLFFGTLNQRMGKDAKGQPYRAFAKDEGFQKNRTTYGVDTLYRYEDHFRDPDTALGHFADVPFLNGGLFECLDRTEERTNKKLYLDGFSRNKTKRAYIPNHLFFGSEHEEDLSGAYGDTKRKKEKVRGLLHILNAYKFTIVENTPVDQEIALDPELLGKVFENLLASYNEETKTTARKQTGSFYTPRPIVEYMVDESLKAHLSDVLAKAGMSEQDIKSGLDILFAYTERAHPFNEKEVPTLLDAIHTCKILDPACGSGAFPMGMLHKLVYIIHKLDPDNALWKQIQIDAAADIPDFSAREAAVAAIERDFTDNEDDYGRKLYLIENCLYGVDIQPIAIQIAKLRFFISLVADQRTNRNKRENHGIRPLPNLETKFVAADALIGLPDMDQLALLPPQVHQIESRIEGLYHRHFSVQRRDEKLVLQKKIRDLREDLGEILAESLGSSMKARHIADWDPFDPQTVAGFFDPLWMFGRSLAKGFTIIIGNPPYIEFKKLSADLKHRYEPAYSSASGKYDIFVLFVERAGMLSSEQGYVCFIIPNTFLRKDFGRGIRKFIAETLSPILIQDFGDIQMFEGPINYTGIFLFKKGLTNQAGHFPFHRYKRVGSLNNPSFDSAVNSLRSPEATDIKEVTRIENIGLSLPTWDFQSLDTNAILVQIERDHKTLADYTTAIFQGIASGKDEVFYVSQQDALRLGLEPELLKPLLKGRDVKRYCLDWSGTYVVYPYNEDSQVIPESELERLFPATVTYLRDQRPQLSGRPYFENSTKRWYELWNQRKKGNFERLRIVSPEISDRNNFARTSAFYGNTKTYHILLHDDSEESYSYFLALLNSSVLEYFYKSITTPQAGGFYAYKTTFLERIPIAAPNAGTRGVFAALVPLIEHGYKSRPLTVAVQFFEDLIDACVMECYFRRHMAERDLLFLDDLAPHLAAYDPGSQESQQREFTEKLYSTLNAPASKIRNRLLRISADSPDLLAVIKAEGKA
jgi:adenine-specific DNA-methyltransferase